MYKTITPIQFANAIHALQRGAISFKAFRVYFATIELKAIREAAREAKKGDRQATNREACFKKEELVRLTKTVKGGVAGQLHALKRAGLLTFSSTEISVTETPIEGSFELLTELAGGRSPARPIPIPRRALRFLAKTKKALAMTMIAYMLRGLTLDRQTGQVRGVGTVKASWISDVTGLSLRAVKAARAELLVLNFITQDMCSTQRKLNRTGSYFCINLDWQPAAQGKELSDNFTYRTTQSQEEKALVILHPQAPESAPNLHPHKNTRSLPSELKTRNLEVPTPVVSASRQGAGEPDIRDVKPIDLEQFGRTEKLYQQAAEQGLIQDSEAMFLNWISAAVRAKTCETATDRTKVFMGIVRRGLWKHITQAEEDRARAAIFKYRQTPKFTGRLIENLMSKAA